MERRNAAAAPSPFGWAALALYVGSVFLPLYELRPNRIAAGVPLHAWDGIALAAAETIGMAACAYSLLRGKEATARGATLFAALCLIAAPAFLGLSAAGGAGFQRVSPAAGFWLYAAAWLLALRRTGGEQAATGARRSAPAALATYGPIILFLLALAGLAFFGFFDRFSPYMELRSQGPRFWSELLRHASLSGTSFLTAFVLGTLGAIVVAKGGIPGRFLSAAAGAVQNIPSLALFGLLLPAMAAIADRFPALRSAGISGIGVAPAFIALTAYALLPVMLSGAAGLRMVDRGAVEAAVGMGMKPIQVLFRVELPLALPSLAAGARTALVQTIGTTTVAALIGAGGMGYFIFQGVGQAAMDMVILGVVPIVALSFAADRAMARLHGALARGASA